MIENKITCIPENICFKLEGYDFYVPNTKEFFPNAIFEVKESQLELPHLIEHTGMKRNTTKLTKSQKIHVWARDKNICQYCYRDCEDKPTVDHKKARVDGGSNEYTNLVTACRDCNFRKSLRETKLIKFSPYL